MNVAKEETHPPREVVVSSGLSGLSQMVVVGPNRLVVDEAAAVGGTDHGPNPYDLLLASLGACTSMTLSRYARRKGWPLEGVTVRLRHGGNYAADCADSDTRSASLERIERDIELAGPLTGEQRSRLFEIARRSPVSRSLTSEIHVRTRLAT